MAAVLEGGGGGGGGGAPAAMLTASDSSSLLAYSSISRSASNLTPTHTAIRVIFPITVGLVVHIEAMVVTPIAGQTGHRISIIL